MHWTWPELSIFTIDGINPGYGRAGAQCFLSILARENVLRHRRPFMAMRGRHYPEAEYLVTGVLGPGSNAHGPNEFLHIPTGKRVTACVAHVLAEHASAAGRRDGRRGQLRLRLKP